MDEINIRKAKSGDLKELMDILNQLSPSSEEKDTEKLQSTFDKINQDKNYHLCVAEENNQLVGTGLLLIQMNISHNGRPYAHIENIVVDKNHRKKGIGKKIILYLVEKAKKAGCYKIILDCEKKNIPFYEKCGLYETGEVEMRLDCD
ncbi:GNAT family N-acetyltransferase [Candidatus Woesearchaeota archaeon]|nr:GNAT family N-acetyltransferase [Candidatus Woesearchaeota archaeon]